ncbi:MAG: 16S rRNA (guanine(527)-N(7))-methyltransferase RsmG [Oscillospiraceae bacterium]|jgi:16S rRNA (guanine527-N7)-methyltransferase
MPFEEQMLMWAAKAGIDLTEEQASAFRLYYEQLIDWNSRMNLTAITAPDEVAVKHFVDSLLLLQVASVPEHAKLADIGTGAGFPSVPIGIVRRDLQLTLADSLNKRVNFLKELCSALNLNAKCIHGRAEDLGRTPSLREQQDLATARAVARMRELSEYCLPFVKVGGLFVALKGPELNEELEEAKPAIRILGGKIREVKEYNLPDGSRRTAVVVEKISQTSTKYPRTPAKISKLPLR